MIGRGLAAAGFLSLCIWPAMARAHSPIAGIGLFYNAMLHPLIVPSHALVVVGLSLGLGQQGRSAVRLGLMALNGAFIAGLVAATAFAAPTPPEPALLGTAVVIAGAVILARRIPRGLIAGAGLAAGLLLGLDSAPDAGDRQDALLALGGLCLGLAGMSTIIAGTSLTLERVWQRIAIRIIGSWIAAIAVLVLTLLVHSARPAGAGAGTEHRPIVTVT